MGLCLVLPRSTECDYRMGFGLDVGFIDHLYTRLKTTSNYSAIADLRTLRITTASAVSSLALRW
jgi:hypothetical protein